MGTPETVEEMLQPSLDQMTSKRLDVFLLQPQFDIDETWFAGSSLVRNLRNDSDPFTVMAAIIGSLAQRLDQPPVLLETDKLRHYVEQVAIDMTDLHAETPEVVAAWQADSLAGAPQPDIVVTRAAEAFYAAVTDHHGYAFKETIVNPVSQMARYIAEYRGQRQPTGNHSGEMTVIPLAEPQSA